VFVHRKLRAQAIKLLLSNNEVIEQTLRHIEHVAAAIRGKFCADGGAKLVPYDT
jgi:hypothetical protein